jgi:hypothetical protein
LVAGQALPDGLLTRRVPIKGFKDVLQVGISSSFAKLRGAKTVTGYFKRKTVE